MGARRLKPACTCGGCRSVPNRPRPSASPSACATHPKAGATTSTGTSSSTTRRCQSGDRDRTDADFRSASLPMSRLVTAVRHRAIEGGRVTSSVDGFRRSARGADVRSDLPARVRLRLVRRVLDVIVPAGLEGGRAPVRVAGVPGETAFIDIAAPFATGLHQVDNPVFDRDGNLYVTYSGTRGQQVPVSIFRVRPNGTRETFSSGIVNPTSMAIDPRGPAVRVEPFRGDGLPGAGGRIGRAVRDRSRRRVRPRVRARRHAVCRRSIGHDLPGRSRRQRRRRSRRCRRAWRRFTSRSAPTTRCTSPARRCRPYDALYRVDPDGAVTPRYAGVRPAAGARLRPATARCSSSRRSPASSGLYRVPPTRRAGTRARRVRAGRRRVRSARRRSSSRRTTRRIGCHAPA